MVGEFHYAIKNHFDALGELAAAVSANSQQRGFSKHVSYQIDLVLEELVTNIIKYGFDDDGEHLITVDIAFGADQVIVLTIRDDGHFFDPTGAVASNGDIARHVPLEQMHVGGWGLSLVRQNSQTFTYERQDNCNLMRITFKD